MSIKIYIELRNIYMDSKDRLKTARESIALTQTDFGVPLGLSQANVRDLESGKVKFSTLHALAIEKIHGISSNWLLDGSGGMKKGTYPLADGLKSADFGRELGEGFVQVPRYEVAASAGGGAMIHSEQIVDHLSFKAEWVHNTLGVSVKDLALIHVTGDSMEPTLSEGDLILIDMSYRGMKDNAIYVLQLNGSLLVKRLQHKLDGGVLVKSDNAIYDSEMVPSEAVDLLNVIGRVVWCGRRM